MKYKLVKALYLDTINLVRAYGKLLTSSVVYQSDPPSPVLFSLVVNVFLKLTFSLIAFSKDWSLGVSLADLTYASDSVLFGGCANNIQSFNRLDQQC